MWVNGTRTLLALRNCRTPPQVFNRWPNTVPPKESSAGVPCEGGHILHGWRKITGEGVWLSTHPEGDTQSRAPSHPKAEISSLPLSMSHTAEGNPVRQIHHLGVWLSAPPERHKGIVMPPQGTHVGLAFVYNTYEALGWQVFTRLDDNVPRPTGEPADHQAYALGGGSRRCADSGGVG
jgi:hypothetical protein